MVNVTIYSIHGSYGYRTQIYSCGFLGFRNCQDDVAVCLVCSFKFDRRFGSRPTHRQESDVSGTWAFDDRGLALLDWVNHAESHLGSDSACNVFSNWCTHSIHQPTNSIISTNQPTSKRRWMMPQKQQSDVSLWGQRFLSGGVTRSTRPKIHHRFFLHFTSRCDYMWMFDMVPSRFA